MSTATKATFATRPELGTAILRGILGIIFAAHGAQKLFVFGLEGVAGGFAQMGVPLAPIAGPTVAFIEFFGGAALALGLFSRVSATLLAGVMAGAMVMVHLPNGFFLPNGIEFVLALLAGAAAIAVGGPGAFAVDNVLAARKADRVSGGVRSTDGVSAPVAARTRSR